MTIAAAAFSTAASAKSTISFACNNNNVKRHGYYWRKVNDQDNNINEETKEDSVLIQTSDDNINEETKEDSTLIQTSDDNKLEIPTRLEEWKIIVTKTGLIIPTHEVSNHGKIRSIARPTIIRIGASDRDALRFETKIDGKKRSFGVHDIVKSTHDKLPSNPKMQIWHKIKPRTDNRIDNLEWVTESEFKSRLEYDNAKKVRVTYLNGQKLPKIYGSIGKAAEATDIINSTISNICNNNINQRTDILFEFVKK